MYMRNECCRFVGSKVILLFSVLPTTNLPSETSQGSYMRQFGDVSAHFWSFSMPRTCS